MKLLPDQQAPALPQSTPQLTPEMEQLLAQLKDIHEPAAIGWWPLAPGWWIAAGLLATALFFAAVFAWRLRQKRLRNRYRAEGQCLLQAVDTAAPRAVEQINILLKRVAVVTFGRRRCAALTGQGWVDFLQQTSPEPLPEAARRALIENLYRVEPPAQRDIETLQQFAIGWVRRHALQQPQSPASATGEVQSV